MAEQAKPKRQRVTRQKQLIRQIVASTSCHPSAEWIYREARKQMPRISLGTVYRNLQELAEDGSIWQLTFGDDKSHYDGNTAFHAHFICSHCGRVFDCSHAVPPLSWQQANLLPGKTTGCRLEFYGICDDCAAEAAAKTASEEA